MSKSDIFNEVDVFWGNGAVNPAPPQGMVCGWNWLKAQTGNTHPGAQLPLGWVSACPYSGAYPTGYGTNDRSWSGPTPQIYDRKVAWGITHFHHSGTGFVGYFYNYILCTPSSKGCDTTKISSLDNESAQPGFYRGTLTDYAADFELTTTRTAAIHKYTFQNNAAHLDIDLNAIGLRIKKDKHFDEAIDHLNLKQTSSTSWSGSLTANGIPIHFAILADSTPSNASTQNGRIAIDVNQKHLALAIGFSMLSEEKAIDSAQNALELGFEKAREQAKIDWCEHLNAIQADFPTDAERKRFYSALYHSLVKPARHDGGYIDFTTMWDIYRTQLPLVLAISKKHARPMLISMLETSEKLGFFPILYGMTNKYDLCSQQATALAIYTLCDGFWRGFLEPELYPRIKIAVNREIAHANIEGKSPSHILDLAGACNAAKLVAGKMGDSEWKQVLEQKAQIWKSAYDTTTGLLPKDKIYYEGNHRNYSFRPHLDMNTRVQLAGGTQRFNRLLDDFFAVDCKTFNDERIIREGYFEGMNNETDMDTPYAYLWCGRADRLATISDLIRRCQFTDGIGGAPGNVDSGGLSSWYVWSCLGIYPLTGSEYYLLGSPSVSQATINMPKGTLNIKVQRNALEDIYPCEYKFNGKSFKTPWMPIEQVENGGVLTFKLTSTPTTSPIPDWL